MRSTVGDNPPDPPEQWDKFGRPVLTRGSQIQGGDILQRYSGHVWVVASTGVILCTLNTDPLQGHKIQDDDVFEGLDAFTLLARVYTRPKTMKDEANREMYEPVFRTREEDVAEAAASIRKDLPPHVHT